MADSSVADAAVPNDPRQSAFFQANLAAFAEYAPHLHVRLEQTRSTPSRLIVDDDGAIDIAFGDRRYYGMDVVAYTQCQVDAFMAKPERRYIENVTLRDLDGVEGRFEAVLKGVLQDEGVEPAARRIVPENHFTLVFGLGLGLHLAPLLEFTGCAELIVVEPSFDNLYHSLFVTDWRALFDQAAQAGCTIHLVLDKDQPSIASHLRKLIRQGGPALVDGIYVYQHAPSAMLTEARASFHRDFSIHVLGLGFFEDELVMMANAVANLQNTDLRVLDAPQLPRREPVIICGSGPSIDANLEIIAAQRDRAVIVSMGSCIRTLLAHGIRPDFHVETENHPANARNIDLVAAEFGIGGITLIGAATVQPSVTRHFDRVILYHRDRQSPSEVFAAGFDKMGSSGPAVANAALVTLAHLGFRDLYLFGVDMGSRDAEHYHSADTYIGIGENPEWAGQARVPVPANFGGTAVTETILAWSRLAFESVLNIHRDLRCINCSDGARIARATPMLPSVLDLPGAALDRDRVNADIFNRLPAFPLATARRVWHEADLTERSHELYGRIDALLAAAAAEDDPGLGWIQELFALYDEIDAKSPALGIFLFGTMCLFTGIVWWHDGRVADAAVRRRLRRAAVGELRTVYRAMERRLDRLFGDVERALAGAQETIDPAFDA